MAKQQQAQQWYMITVIGIDRPGIVAALSQALFQAGCNLGETSMIRLGGNFTIMMMVNSSASAAKIKKILQPVADTLQLRVHVDAIEAQLHAHKQPDVQIILHGADRAGIVADVTAALAQAGLHILDLNSDVAGSEAKPVYIMMIEGFAAQGLEALEQALAPLRQQGIDARVTPLDTLVG